MVIGLESLLNTFIESSGFIGFQDFTNVDTLQYKNDYLAFYSIKNIKYSRMVYSYDNTQYGIEMTGHISIKVLGKRANYNDFSALEQKILNLLNKLGTSKFIIMQSIDREQISMNQTLGRLEDCISFDFKMLISGTIPKEENS